MKKSLYLAMAAGVVAVPAAFAQEYGTLPFGGELRRDPVGYPSGGYQGRAIEIVYDNVSNVFGNGTGGTFLGNNNMIMEDISFAGGPWNNLTGRIATEITFGVAVLGTTPTAANEQVVLVFWDEDDVNYEGFTGTGTAMVNTGATPLAVLRVGVGNVNAGFIWQFTVGLTGLPGGGVVIPDDDNRIFIQSAWVLDTAAPTDWSNLNGLLFEACPSANLRGMAFGSNSLAAAGATANAPTVGQTTIAYGRDMLTATQCAHNGQMIGTAGAPATGGDNEHRQIQVAPAAGPNAGILTQYGSQFRLRGDVPPPPPPASIDLGCPADGAVANNGSFASGDVQWYHIGLCGDASDFSLQFFDADTESSSVGCDIAVFNSSGSMIADDHGSGSGTSSQLSFGVGRRANIGDGLQYDGRNGQLPPGDYYIAVGRTGTTFGGGFTVNAVTGAPTDTFVLNTNTNVNGTPLAPSVTPIVGHDYDALGGPIGFPDARQGLAAATGLRGVLWNHFSLSAEAGSGTSFLDMDFALTSTPTADAVAYIFDANGEMVAFSDDEGLNALPMFSFGVGDGSPRLYNTNPEPYTGQTPGTLPAGDYYVAMALFATQDITLLGGNDRWHVRGTSGSNLTVTGDIYTGGVPGGASCDPDINCDGVPDQGDVACIILVVAGDLSCFCQADPDYNHDGVPDQGDVADVILTVAGAPCP